MIQIPWQVVVVVVAGWLLYTWIKTPRRRKSDPVTDIVVMETQDKVKEVDSKLNELAESSVSAINNINLAIEEIKERMEWQR